MRSQFLEQRQSKIGCKTKLVSLYPRLTLILHFLGETIEYLRKTDIKLWVLTGDKVGTARSIALSCKLIETDMKELLIEGRKEADLEMILKDALNTAINTDSSIIKYAMVTGDAMLTIYNHPALEQKVFLLDDSKCIKINFSSWKSQTTVRLSSLLEYLLYKRNKLLI